MNEGSAKLIRDYLDDAGGGPSIQTISVIIQKVPNLYMEPMLNAMGAAQAYVNK